MNRTKHCIIIKGLFRDNFLCSNENTLTLPCSEVEMNEFYNIERVYPNTKVYRNLYPEGFNEGNFWRVRTLDLNKVIDIF